MENKALHASFQIERKAYITDKARAFINNSYMICSVVSLV